LQIDLLLGLLKANRRKDLFGGRQGATRAQRAHCNQKTKGDLFAHRKEALSVKG
jgi:hypothetical protein